MRPFGPARALCKKFYFVSIKRPPLAVVSNGRIKSRLTIGIHIPGSLFGVLCILCRESFLYIITAIVIYNFTIGHKIGIHLLLCDCNARPSVDTARCGMLFKIPCRITTSSKNRLLIPFFKKQIFIIIIGIIAILIGV